MAAPGPFAFAFDDQADPAICQLLGGLPGRWGRMTPLSRLLLVTVGRLLVRAGILTPGQRCDHLGRQVGLIGATRRGSLHTDLAFIAGMNAGPGLASPSLFGYTLASIPLAEAAGHFGLVGPVYALFDQTDPLALAEGEARRLLALQAELSLMLACSFDHLPAPYGPGELQLTLTLVTRDAASHPGLSALAENP